MNGYEALVYIFGIWGIVTIAREVCNCVIEYIETKEWK